MKRLSKSEFLTLSSGQQNAYAWKILLSNLIPKFILTVLFLAECIFFWWLVTTDNTSLRDPIANYLAISLVFIAAILLVIGFYLLLREQIDDIKKEAAGRKKGIALIWARNEGIAPSASYVNVQYNDKSIKWKVKACDLDWSLSADNPIVEYMRK